MRHSRRGCISFARIIMVLANTRTAFATQRKETSVLQALTAASRTVNVNHADVLMMGGQRGPRLSRKEKSQVAFGVDSSGQIQMDPELNLGRVDPAHIDKDAAFVEALQRSSTGTTANGGANGKDQHKEGFNILTDANKAAVLCIVALIMLGILYYTITSVCSRRSTEDDSEEIQQEIDTGLDEAALNVPMMKRMGRRQGADDPGGRGDGKELKMSKHASHDVVRHGTNAQDQPTNKLQEWKKSKKTEAFLREQYQEEIRRNLEKPTPPPPAVSTTFNSDPVPTPDSDESTTVIVQAAGDPAASGDNQAMIVNSARTADGQDSDEYPGNGKPRPQRKRLAKKSSPPADEEESAVSPRPPSPRPTFTGPDAHDDPTNVGATPSHKPKNNRLAHNNGLLAGPEVKGAAIAPGFIIQHRALPGRAASPRPV